MDEEFKPTEYQRTVMQAACSRLLSHELRNIQRLIHESKYVLKLCDCEFDNSEIAKKMESADKELFMLEIEMNKMYACLINKEANDV